MPLSSAPSLTPSDPPPRGASSTAESGCLHELVWAQAQRTPDATAVTCAGGDLSYADLVARAAAVASELRAHGVGAGAIVAVAVSRGPDLVPALLGVLASGAAWTALDARQPAARLRWLIDDAQPAVILVDAACAESVSGAGPPRLDVAHILRSAAPGRAVSLVSPGSGVGPRDVAALIYTSGSTGAPKGALLEHDGLVRLVTNWSQVPGLAADDVVLGLSSAAFDMAILDVFLPLSLGARLVLADERTTADGAALARLAESQGATFILATPSTWRLLLAGELRPRGRLRGVAGGEALTPELAGALLALGVELFNGYGVTEASACSCIARVTDPTGPISVGAPSPGVRVDILDDAGAPVADGGIGELWIGGRGVARGYHRRPELTAAYFSAASSSPDGRRYRTGDMARREVDGRITLHGRRDDQVKVRGHRVELGEVEACLLADAEVREACVFSVTGRGGEVALVAVVVAEDGVPDGGRMSGAGPPERAVAGGAGAGERPRRGAARPHAERQGGPEPLGAALLGATRLAGRARGPRARAGGPGRLACRGGPRRLGGRRDRCVRRLGRHLARGDAAGAAPAR
jgi:amino acid adenylation domain-containing protein